MSGAWTRSSRNDAIETPVRSSKTASDAPGATWSHVLKRGTALRITDSEGGANVGALFYNWDNPAERYNMPDTLKAQHIARLTRGDVLYLGHGAHPLLDHRRHRRLARPAQRVLRRGRSSSGSTARRLTRSAATDSFRTPTTSS